MKVLFVSDFSLDHNSGGAQVSNDHVIKEGLLRGYDITLHNYDSSPTNLLTNYDLVISSNMELLHKNEYLFHYITNHPQHVRLEHDSCSYLNNEDRQKLFESSKKNFFLSNFHINFFKKLYGNYFKNIEIVYDQISSSLFKKEEKDKIYDVVYCGFLHPLKGLGKLLDFAKQNPQNQIYVFGWGDAKALSSCANINYMGEIENNEVAEIFKKSKKVFHSPIVNEPFCRMVAEAILCGCEIIGDTEKIGSFLEYKLVGEQEFKTKCNNAAKIFWDKIDE